MDGPMDNPMDNSPVDHRLTTGRPQLTHHGFIWITVTILIFLTILKQDLIPHFRLIYGLEYSRARRLK